MAWVASVSLAPAWTGLAVLRAPARRSKRCRNRRHIGFERHGWGHRFVSGRDVRHWRLRTEDERGVLPEMEVLRDQHRGGHSGRLPRGRFRSGDLRQSGEAGWAVPDSAAFHGRISTRYGGPDSERRGQSVSARSVPYRRAEQLLRHRAAALIAMCGICGLESSPSWRPGVHGVLWWRHRRLFGAYQVHIYSVPQSPAVVAVPALSPLARAFTVLLLAGVGILELRRRSQKA